MLSDIEIQCPYCWEFFPTEVDPSVGEQVYVKDCRIGCQPILIRVVIGPDGEPSGVEVRRENE